MEGLDTRRFHQGPRRKHADAGDVDAVRAMERWCGGPWPTAAVCPLTNTILLVESAGRPSHYIAGRYNPLSVADRYDSGIHLTGWANPRNAIRLNGSTVIRTPLSIAGFGTCGLNCTNNLPDLVPEAAAYSSGEMYSFVPSERLQCRDGGQLHDRIAISEEARSKGLGERLYNAAIQAFADKVSRIVCEVNRLPPNPGSQRFRERLGFKAIGARNDF